MSGTDGSTIKSFKKEYRIGTSLASTKAEIKSSMKNVQYNRSVAKALERGVSDSRIGFYKEIQRKNSGFTSSGDLMMNKERPESKLSKLSWKNGQIADFEKEWRTKGGFHLEEPEPGSKRKNLNLGAHFERTHHFFSKKGLNRPQTVQASETHLRNDRQVPISHFKSPSLVHSDDKKGSESKKNSQVVKSRDQTLEEKQEEEWEGQAMRIVRERKSTDTDVIRERYERNPQLVLDEEYMELEKFKNLLGVVKEKEDKEREEMIERQMKLMNSGKFVGKYADFEPILPHENFSLYMEGEPEFNNQKNKVDFVREPIIKVQQKDEAEVRQLMEEARDRFDFYAKHTEVRFDKDYKMLKGSQVRLTRIETEKIRKEYASKAAR